MNSDANAKARYVIEFDFVVITGLFVGSGEDRQMEPPECDERLPPAERPFVAAWTKNRDVFFVPGASVKGALLARAGGALGPKDTANWVSRLFGRLEDPSKEQGLNSKPGLAEFGAANCQSPPFTVEGRSAICRDTGTVEQGKLFFEEVVQPGATFRSRVVLQACTAQDAGQLRALLASCTSAKPLSLGAHGRAGWGQVVVPTESIKVKVFDVQTMKAWLSQTQASDGLVKNWEDSAQPCNLANVPVSKDIAAPELLRLPVKLAFDGPFACADPKHLKEKNKPDNKARASKDGHAMLPGTSLLGSLRNQAERIVRTLGGTAGSGHDATALNTTAPPADLPSLLFGCAGWRGVVGVAGPFVSEDKPIPPDQHMVALCRITGGGKDTAKFLMQCWQDPELHGELTLDWHRLQVGQIPPDRRDAALGLLQLVLVDLRYGDIGFGMARSKGWGWVKPSDNLLELANTHWWKPTGKTPVELIAAMRGYLPVAETSLTTLHVRRSRKHPNLPLQQVKSKRFCVT
jgi:CRISPR/Cas system CSM-associated protein Csm3 (group 7 of RAMP superfamily)